MSKICRVCGANPETVGDDVMAQTDEVWLCPHCDRMRNRMKYRRDPNLHFNPPKEYQRTTRAAPSMPTLETLRRFMESDT